MTPEEQRRWLIAYGYNPDEYELISETDAAARDTTKGSAFLTGLKQSVGPTIGGLGLAAAPLVAASGPIGWGAVGLSALGGFVGSYLGGEAQDEIEKVFLDDAEERALTLQRQAAHEKHPWMTWLGQAAPSGLAFGPSLTTIRNLPGAIKNAPLRSQTALERYALGNMAMGGALEGGVELGAQALTGQDIDWGRVGGAAALGGLFTEPTRAYGKLGAVMSRKGQTSKEWLDEKNLSRPLTEDEAIVANRTERIAGLKAARMARDKYEQSVIDRVVEADGKKLSDSIEEPTLDEMLTAEKDATEDIDRTKEDLNTASEKLKALENGLKAEGLSPDIVRVKRKQRETLTEEVKKAQETHTEALNSRIMLRAERTALQDEYARVKFEIDERKKRWGDEDEPVDLPDEEIYQSVRGLVEKRGFSMVEAMDTIRGRDKSGNVFDLKGEFDPTTKTATISKKLMSDDTPWHEYLHGLLNVMRRSAHPRHRQLIDFIDNNMFKRDDAYLKMSAEERKDYAEEQLAQRGGVLMNEQMTNPPKGFVEGLKRWFEDWQLERDIKKGFEADTPDAYLNRLAEWLAMRGRREPALQPRQIKDMYAGLSVRAPGILPTFTEDIESGKRYARDVTPEDAPDEMRSRVGNIIRQSLAATKGDSISKEHINNLIAAAVKSGKISDEDTKWNSQLLKNFEDYENKKIPREKVEEFLDAFEYRVTTVENVDGVGNKVDKPLHDNTTMIRGENYKIRVLKMPHNVPSGESTFINGMHIDFGAGEDAIGWVRSNDQYLASDGSKSTHIIEGQSDLHQTLKAEKRIPARSLDEYNIKFLEDGRYVLDEVFSLPSPERTPWAGSAEYYYGSLFAVPDSVSGVSSIDLTSDAIRDAIRDKLRVSKGFTYGGYKYTYDASTDKLTKKPYVQRYTEKDLIVEWDNTIKSHPVRIVRLPNGISPLNRPYARMWDDEFLSELDTDHSDVIEALLRRGESERFFSQEIGPDHAPLEVRTEKVIASGRTGYESLDITIAPVNDKVLPDVPFKGNRYVSALARDTIMSAVRDGNESVTWPSTIEEVHNTQQYSSDKFITSEKTGEPLAIYNLYVHGRHTTPDGTDAYDFKGDGSGKKSLFDDAFEKIIKDFKEYGPEGWKVEKDALTYETLVLSGNTSRLSIKPDNPRAKSIEVHKLTIPPKLRELLVREGGIESAKFQRATPEELDSALTLALKYAPDDVALSRARQGGDKQTALVSFASRPFPSIMSGEEMAQVVNALKMYHGSPEADAIRREGFRGEELSDKSLHGRGIYLTPSKRRASKYAAQAEPIEIKTQFKKLLNLDKTITNGQDFIDAALAKAKELGYEILPDSVRVPVDNKLKTLVYSLYKPLQGKVNSVLHAMGYDGSTLVDIFRGTRTAYERHRTVVAFREPFEKANGALQEYHSDKLLQRQRSDDEVDAYLKEVDEYQINSLTDHYASNPAVLRQWILDSVTTKLGKLGDTLEERRTARLVEKAFVAAAREAVTLEGEFINAFEFGERGNVTLSRADAEHTAIYLAFDRRELPVPAETAARFNETNSAVKHYVEWFRARYGETRAYQLAEKMKIYHPKTGELLEPGKHASYAPEMISQTKWRELSGKKGAHAREKAMNELRSWWKTHRASAEAISDADIDKAVNAYVSRLQGSDLDHLGSSHFAALRKAEGIGLPLTMEDGHFTWIERDAGSAYTRYMRRFAHDFSFFKHVENDPTQRQILGIPNPATGEQGPAWVKTKNPFHVETESGVLNGQAVQMNLKPTTDVNIRNFIKAYLGYYQGEELFGRTANRFVVSHWLGFASGTRDLLSSYVFALPHLRGVDMPQMLLSLKDFRQAWEASHRLGVNRGPNRIEHDIETHNKLADAMNRWSDFASVIGGRTPLERITRTLQFALGRATMLQQLALAPGASKTADRTLRQMAEASGVDLNAMRQHADKSNEFKLEDHDNQLDRMAAAWVEANQGTYDVRGVPSWTLSGPAATYSSLARWSIEKFNMMKQEVVKPLRDEGDWRPLIKSTLGAVFVGSVLLELMEVINNKLRSNPTLMEAVREGDEEEIGYAVADALNYAGYFGIASALMNDWGVQAMRGQRPRGGGFVFPAWDFVTDSYEPVHDALEAIGEGEDPFPTAMKGILGIVRQTMQSFRILWNQGAFDALGADARKELDDANMRRDLRIFRRFEGIRGVSPVKGLGNQYLRPQTRAFKEAETPEEAAAILPEAFEEQRRRAKGRGDKLKSYTEGLYVIPDKTVPSPETREGAEEFLRYRDYIIRQYGAMKWERIYNNWVKNKHYLTPTKKMQVKSYVQHIMGQQ